MIALPRLDERYARRFSRESFLEKSRRTAGTVGREALEKAFAMYYAMRDADTPAWAKTTIAAALGYFIMPMDAVADLIPIAGYADDMSMILLALGTVAAHIKPKHFAEGKARVAAWFDKPSGGDEESATPS